MRRWKLSCQRYKNKKIEFDQSNQFLWHMSIFYSKFGFYYHNNSAQQLQKADKWQLGTIIYLTVQQLVFNQLLQFRTVDSAAMDFNFISMSPGLILNISMSPGLILNPSLLYYYILQLENYFRWVTSNKKIFIRVFEKWTFLF